MMATILNSAIMDSVILHKKNFTHSLQLNLTMTAILNSAILNLAILDAAIIVFLSKSLTLAKIGSDYLHKKTFTHSLWLNLMMAAILNSAMMD